MRPISLFCAAALAALAACGTKTPLTMPTPVPAASTVQTPPIPASSPASDNSNKAADTRQ